MKKSELLARIVALEARVQSLEARLPVNVPWFSTKPDLPVTGTLTTTWPGAVLVGDTYTISPGEAWSYTRN